MPPHLHQRFCSCVIPLSLSTETSCENHIAAREDVSKAAPDVPAGQITPTAEPAAAANVPAGAPDVPAGQSAPTAEPAAVESVPVAAPDVPDGQISATAEPAAAASVPVAPHVEGALACPHSDLVIVVRKSALAR